MTDEHVPARRREILGAKVEAEFAEFDVERQGLPPQDEAELLAGLEDIQCVQGRKERFRRLQIADVQFDFIP
jgi:hypothetical protein